MDTQLLKQRHTTKTTFLTLKIFVFTTIITLLSKDFKFPIKFCAAFCIKAATQTFLSLCFVTPHKDKNGAKDHCIKGTNLCISAFLNIYFINNSVQVAISALAKNTLCKPFYYFCLDYVLVDIWFNSAFLTRKWFNLGGQLKYIEDPLKTEISIFLKGVCNGIEKYTMDYTFSFLRNSFIREGLVLYKPSKRLKTDKNKIDWRKFTSNIFTDVLFFTTKNKFQTLCNKIVLHFVPVTYNRFKSLEWLFPQYQPVIDVAVFVFYKHFIKLFTEHVEMGFVEITKPVFQGIGLINVSAGHSPAEII